MAMARQIEGDRQKAWKRMGTKTLEGTEAARFKSLHHGVRAATILAPRRKHPEMGNCATKSATNGSPQAPANHPRTAPLEVHYLAGDRCGDRRDDGSGGETEVEMERMSFHVDCKEH